ncbi:MAG: orotidine 5'-phosphate decarboxylase / HUMPS family protein, partial [Caldimicrobium sp.]
MRNPQDSLIFPLDFNNLEEALFWVKKLKPFVGIFKVGLELFVKEGPKVIEEIKKKGAS